MTDAWVLVADAARARIFSVDGPRAKMRSVEQLVSPGARLHDRDINADRPGRAFDSFGEGRHAIDTNAKEQGAIRFARQVVDRLEQGRIGSEFDRLIVVAEAHFLGLLRKASKPALQKMISLEINKDLSKATDQEIREHLPERL